MTPTGEKTYEVSCVNGHRLRIKAALFGKEVRCPTCHVTFIVGEAPPDAPDADADSRSSAEQRTVSPSRASAPPFVPGQAPGRSAAARSVHSSRLLGMNSAIGQTLLLLGLLAVVGARGWDLIGERDVARASAKLETAQAQSPQPANLPALQTAAQDAKERNAALAYWRQWGFVVGTLVLMVGLLATAFAGQGADRWVCLVIVAIITYSLFIGGSVWGALTGLVR